MPLNLHIFQIRLIKKICQTLGQIQEWRQRISTSLSPVTQQPQEHQKQINEIQVKPEGSHDGAFTDDRLTAVHDPLLSHAGDLLDIIGGQPGEYNHPDPGNYPGHHRTGQKDIHHHGDDNPDEAHEEEGPPAGEISLGDKPVDCHCTEHAGGDEKSRCH